MKVQQLLVPAAWVLWKLERQSHQPWFLPSILAGFWIGFGWIGCMFKSKMAWNPKSIEIPNPSKLHKLHSMGFQGLRQVHLALVCSIAGQRCLPPCVIAKVHVQPIPPNERTRCKRLKTLPSLSRGQLVRLKKQDWMVGGFNPLQEIKPKSVTGGH